MDNNFLFPTSPGLYIVTRGNDTAILIKITGVYPTLVLEQGIDLLDNFKKVNKDLLNHIVAYQAEYRFSKSLGDINVCVSKSSFVINADMLELDSETKNSIRLDYFRFRSMGLSRYTCNGLITTQYHITVDLCNKLFERFDKE